MRRLPKPTEPTASSDTRRSIAFVLDGRRRSLALLTATAFIGGACEALFLVTATRLAFAVTEGDERVGVVAGRFLQVNAVLLLLAALVAARVVLASWASWQSAELSSTVVARTRTRLGTAFLHASWAKQQRQRGGSLQELMSTYSNHTSNTMGAMSQLLIAGANLLAMLSLAVVVDPLGALILAVAVVVLGSLLRPLRSAVRRRSARVAEANMDFATHVNEISELGLELHVYRVQDAADHALHRTIERYRRRSRRLNFAQGLATPAYIGLAYMALVGALAFVAASDSASLTSLGASMLVMLRSLSYGQALQGSYVTVSSSAPVIAELMRELEGFEAAAAHDGGEPVGSIGTLSAEHVSFRYNDHEGPVLRDVTFELPARSVVGIVGPSGSGKSTLVQLLLRLRPPDEGRILSDNRDVSRFAAADWARKVTFVPQDAHLITGTIEDNIRFMREDVTPGDVERAARLAYLHDDIVAMPGGYQRRLGEDGGRLSGGQQQRLTIARALVEHPDVLILDEPTSALDVRSEHLIRSTLESLRDQMTIIIIAHRLSTLEICDRIMVIQDGRLVGFDAPHELEASNEFYREALVLSGLR
jgi:ABC-type multidrug transport system fused ATPase/permease subunit